MTKNERTTKTGLIDAWLPAHCVYRPHELHDLPGDVLAEAIGLASHDMSGSGWVRIGLATVTIELMPLEQCIKDTIEALRREQGDLQAKATRIEDEVQKLLTIGYEVRNESE